MCPHSAHACKHSMIVHARVFVLLCPCVDGAARSMFLTLRTLMRIIYLELDALDFFTVIARVPCQATAWNVAHTTSFDLTRVTPPPSHARDPSRS